MAKTWQVFRTFCQNGVDFAQMVSHCFACFLDIGQVLMFPARHFRTR